MVLIIKRQNLNECFVVKMSDHGDPQGDRNYPRLFEIVENRNLDKFFNRKKLYQTIIDKLIQANLWNNREYEDSDVTNTLHKWIADYFQNNGIIKYFVEVDENVFN